MTRWFAGALVALACASPAAPRPTEAALVAGAVADVAGDAIASDTVARAASAQGLSPREARDLAVRDALFARAARDELDPRLVAGIESATLARALLDELEQRARAAGPPTDAEVATLTERHFVELDRPAAVRTVHAVALVEGSTEAAARDLAARVARAVQDATSADDFTAKARAVEADPKKLHVESLPAVAADGRTLPDREHPEVGSFDADFARSANALQNPGDTSAPARSAYGFHVIRLVERVPELRVPLEERRKHLADEALSERARSELDAIVRRTSEAHPAVISRAVDELTAFATEPR